MTDLSELTGAPHGRRFPAGAEPSGDGFSFRVWAPAHRKVTVEMTDGRSFPLDSEDGGYFSAVLPVRAGDRYQLRLGRRDELLPDPVSRFQPEGLSGPSEVVDPRTFSWTDSGWRGVAARGQVLYELHIGTFTPEGTWNAAIAKLDTLRDVGITTIELMPLATFDASFGWGYDGVLLYAPNPLYGTPDDVRRFVDAAHARDLGVVLDVVYNHFGAGDCFEEFAPDYFRKGAANEWGKSLNFDAKRAKPSRDYFVANAMYWIEEFRFDGLRLDAAHAMEDESDEHVIHEIARKTRLAAGGKSIFLAAENEPQDAALARPQARGGLGLDAIWNEDFHHSAVVAATSRREAYLHDHLGTAQELLAAAKYGLLYQGQRYDWQNRPRGSNGLDLRPPNFVNYLQNHDQVANSATGVRFWQRTSPSMARAMTAFFLLAPQTPLLFQGQEFAASTPFFYFLGKGGTFGEEVAEGRADFLQQFQSVRDPAATAKLHVPADPETFAASKLDWADFDAHSEVVALHRDLIGMRRTDPAFSRQPSPRDGQLDGNVLGPAALLLRYFAEESGDDRLVILNLGHDLPLPSIPDPLAAPPTGLEWVLTWSSEDTRYGGDGKRETDLAERATMPGEALVVFGLQPAREPRPMDPDAQKQWQRDLF